MTGTAARFSVAVGLGQWACFAARFYLRCQARRMRELWSHDGVTISDMLASSPDPLCEDT